jgi:hypothetical protein
MTDDRDKTRDDERNPRERDPMSDDINASQSSVVASRRPSSLRHGIAVPAAHHLHPPAPPLYGVMAEFDNPSDLVTAARKTYEAGYRRINGYSPFPIEELSEAIGFTKTSLPLIVLIGGVLGGVGGFFMQYWMEVINYPLNVGGKPLNSWPAFIPITFECTVLCAAFAAVFGMLALNKLPQPYHPVFNAPNFALATRDRFFLVIEANDPHFDHGEVLQFMKQLGPRDITDVEV